MADLKVNIQNNRYRDAVTKLEAEVQGLKDIVDNYKKLHDQASDCYNSTQTEQLKKAIWDNILNIQSSIGATEAQIAEYNKTQENVDVTNQAISGTLNTAVEAVKGIFTDH